MLIKIQKAANAAFCLNETIIQLFQQFLQLALQSYYLLLNQIKYLQLLAQLPMYQYLIHSMQNLKTQLYHLAHATNTVTEPANSRAVTK